MPRFPDDVAESMSEMSPHELRYLAKRAEQLAEKKEDENAPRQRSKAEVKHNTDKTEFDRKDAPSNATLVTKNIDDRDYFYWNWREDNTVKSEYIAPVNPKK